MRKSDNWYERVNRERLDYVVREFYLNEEDFEISSCIARHFIESIGEMDPTEKGFLKWAGEYTNICRQMLNNYRDWIGLGKLYPELKIRGKQMITLYMHAAGMLVKKLVSRDDEEAQKEYPDPNLRIRLQKAARKALNEYFRAEKMLNG